MKCFKCKKDKGLIKVPSLEKKACSDCFKLIIQKRFNKTVRDMNLKSVTIKLDRPSDEVLYYLFNKRAERVKGFKVKVGNKASINQSTLDDICISIVKSFFTGKDLIIKASSPLGSISEYELAEYSKIVGLKFKGNPRTGQDKRIHDFILRLDMRRPGVMYSLKDFMNKLF